MTHCKKCGAPCGKGHRYGDGYLCERCYGKGGSDGAGGALLLMIGLYFIGSVLLLLLLFIPTLMCMASEPIANAIGFTATRYVVGGLGVLIFFLFVYLLFRKKGKTVENSGCLRKCIRFLVKLYVLLLLLYVSTMLMFYAFTKRGI